MRNPRLTLAAIILGLVISMGSLLSSLVAEQTRWEVPPLDLSRVSDHEPAPTVQRVGEHLWSVDGLPVVVAAGTPRDMGRQYGAAVADLIRKGRDSYLFEHVRDGQGYSMGYMLNCAQSMLKHIAPEYVEEMQGVAEGSGVPYDDILVMHVHADIVHYGHDWGKPRSGGGQASGCSNFIAWGPATVDGKVYHGRNLDWTTGTKVQECAVVYVGIPQQGHPFALVTYAGMIGGVTGMNAAGITFGEMTSSTNDETLDGEPLFFICRRILQYCGNIAQVEQMVQSYHGTTGWNFMIASGKEGTGRAFEVDAGDVVTFRPNDPLEYDPPLSQGFEHGLYRTNHPTSQKMLLKAARKYGVKSLALGKVALRAMDTWQRYESLRLWISRTHFGHIDARIARAMLQTAPVAGSSNLHSVVFAPTDLRMWVANATSPPNKQPAYTQPYRLIELERFLAEH